MGHDMRSDTGYDVSDGEWLTYGELAQRRGIDRQSAFKLAARHRWRRQKSNTGHVRVFVPSAFAEAEDKASDRPLDTGYDVSEANRRADAALALADRLGAQLADASTRADEANKRADAAEARSEANVQRADRVEARADQERLAADAERDRITGELAQAVERRTAAEVEARVLREAENARQQLGRWRRAWDGWRGR